MKERNKKDIQRTEIKWNVDKRKLNIFISEASVTFFDDFTVQKLMLILTTLN